MNESKLYKQALKEMSKTTPNTAKAFKLLQSALDNEDENAAYALGTWYLHGRHVKKNHTKAVELLELAAKKNVSAALFDLAVCYEKGTAIKKNKKKAYELYLKSAVWGDRQGFYEVGRCLFYGIGVKQDKNLATIWLDRAKAFSGKPKYRTSNNALGSDRHNKYP
jgi:TPR repeat protein